ncbi:MAG: Gfo/Idh/MocA family protein [Acidimicrobiia bacterium]
MNDGTTPIRVGLIGVGWGSVVQTPAFRMVPPFEVSALCSRRQESVDAAGEKLGIADVSTEWQAFVQRDDLDVISVCTPVDLHHEQALAAIAAGKHVLVEKPVGLDAGQTGEMLAAAEQAGVAHAVCFEGRWEPSRLKIWEMVRAGHLGQPYMAMARSGADFWHPTRGLQSEWMYQRAHGGGYLMGMGSHDIDYVCAMFGEPEAVCADVRTTVAERPRPDGSTLHVDADDTSVVLLRMQNGMLVSITTTAVAFQRNFRAFEAFGSDGSLAMDGQLMGEEPVEVVSGSIAQDQAVVVPSSERRPASGIEPPKRRAAGAILSLALMLEDWLPALSGGSTIAPTLADGHRVARIIDAARQSSAGGGWVSL